MSNLVPIQITLQAATAADAKQLVQDLAGTMSGMAEARIPASTEVSTIAPAAQETMSQQPQQFTPPSAPTQAPQQKYAAPAVPIAQPGPAAPPAPPAGAVPTSTPSYTMEQLGVAAQPLVDAGRGAELVGWLQQHGVSALTQLPKEQYGEFATFLRSLGASI